MSSIECMEFDWVKLDFKMTSVNNYRYHTDDEPKKASNYFHSEREKKKNLFSFLFVFPFYLLFHEMLYTYFLFLPDGGNGLGRHMTSQTCLVS